MKYFYTALVAAVLCANSQSANAFGIGKVAHVTKHVGGKVIDVAKDQVVEHQDAIKDHVVDNVRDHALDVIPYGHVVVPVAEDVIRKVHDNTSETQRQVNVQSYPHAMLGESRKEKRQERHERWKKNFHDMWNKSDDDSDKQSDEGEETDAIQKAADEAAAKIEDEISDKVSEDDLAEFQDEAEEQVGNFENWVDENKDVVEDQQDEWVNHSKEAEDAAVEQVKKTKKKEQDKAEDMQAKGEKGAQQIKEEAEAKAQQEIENQQSEGTAKKMEDKAKEEAEQVKEKAEHNVDNVKEAGESAVEKIKNKLPKWGGRRLQAIQEDEQEQESEVWSFFNVFDTSEAASMIVPQEEEEVEEQQVQKKIEHHWNEKRERHGKHHAGGKRRDGRKHKRSIEWQPLISEDTWQQFNATITDMGDSIGVWFNETVQNVTEKIQDQKYDEKLDDLTDKGTEWINRKHKRAADHINKQVEDINQWMNETGNDAIDQGSEWVEKNAQDAVDSINSWMSYLGDQIDQATAEDQDQEDESEIEEDIPEEERYEIEEKPEDNAELVYEENSEADPSVVQEKVLQSWRDDLKNAAEEKVKEEAQAKIDKEKADIEAQKDKVFDREAEIEAVSGYLVDHLSEEDKEKIQHDQETLDGVIVIEEFAGQDDVKDAAEWIVNKATHEHLDYDTVDTVAKNIGKDVEAQDDDDWN